MKGRQRAFLDDLLGTASPSGFEAPTQRVWLDYVGESADEVHTDEYGNAVAVYEGGGPDLAFAGHADEIGFIIAGVTDEGYVRIAPIGGADRTVSRGQHVDVHTGDGPVPGVVGQTAIHLRDRTEESYDDITEQSVDLGVEGEAAARDLVEVGDPVTVTTPVRDLAGDRLAGPGLDNRVGVWVAAEALRRAAAREADATVHAVSTVQEEVGLRGARMVGFDLAPDAAVAVDVTHAADNPAYPDDRFSEVELGGGPVVARGSANHPALVETAREAADDAEVPLQLQATGVSTGTDADAFYTEAGGIPALNLGLPNRYMHTPAEVVDTRDLDAASRSAAALAETAPASGFSVDL